MRTYVPVLLVLLTVGCASGTPDPEVPQPQAAVPPPETPPPDAAPAAPTRETPAPPASSKAASPAARPAPIGPAPRPVAPPAHASPLTLDLNTLKQRLKDTKAIGIFTKIALKNQVDDLLDEFREFYDGKGGLTMKDLRQSFNLLMMKVLSLLQDEDRALASDIASSREALWGLLADPTTFATLES